MKEYFKIYVLYQDVQFIMIYNKTKTTFSAIFDFEFTTQIVTVCFLSFDLLLLLLFLKDFDFLIICRVQAILMILSLFLMLI